MVGDDTKQYPEIIDYKPHLKIKLDYFNKQGWGYADTALVLDPHKDQIKLIGNRYIFSEKYMPNFKTWASEAAHINFSVKTPK